MTKQATQKQPNIFLFHGEDSFSSSQKLNLWRREFVRKYEGDLNLEVLDGKSLNPANFETNLDTMPFLSEKRMVVVKDIFASKKAEDLKKIAKGLEKTSEFCVVVFHENSSADKRSSLYKTITKIGQVFDFPMLSQKEITDWIVKKARENNIQIDVYTASYLANHLSLNLWSINNELEKLQLFAKDGKITQEMIDNLVTPALSASIFKLTDSISEKNSKQALKTFKILVDRNEDIIKILFIIVRHFRLLIQVKELLDSGENQFSITKKLKQHPFVIKNLSAQAKNFDMEQLEKTYNELLQIDIGIKTGKIKSYQTDTRELQLAIEKLIIGICYNFS